MIDNIILKYMYADTVHHSLATEGLAYMYIGIRR